MIRRLARKVLWGALLMLGACAHVSAPVAPPPPPPPRIKLVVLPVESDRFPAVASALNAALRDARPSGVDDSLVSRVTLEVVQLSIECVDPTFACYAAVGRSLNANRLLIAQLSGGARRRDRSVRVKITLFDVDAGAPGRVAEQLFANREQAVSAMGRLVERVVGPPPTAAQK